MGLRWLLLTCVEPHFGQSMNQCNSSTFLDPLLREWQERVRRRLVFPFVAVAC
jgi:hypothetical protein